MKQITLQSVITGKKEIVAADMDGETVMMGIETGKYYNLGKMGGVIWTLVEQPVSVEAVIEQLLGKYEVTRRQCEEEVLSFLNSLDKEGLLEVQ
ncbi:hypothetical protein SDC9_90309 [bioreactor metagenome]|uniref:Coenzyme PQQ synthesis protein D n=1 Tax=bioreactor metagenome TaxID=1076179 RepID=A0A644ZS05_9ZZZZ